MKFNEINLDTINMIDFKKEMENTDYSDIIEDIYEAYVNASPSVKNVINLLDAHFIWYEQFRTFESCAIVFYRLLQNLSKSEIEYFTKFSLIVLTLINKEIKLDEERKLKKFTNDKSAIILMISQSAFNYSSIVRSKAITSALYKSNFRESSSDNIVFWIRFIYTFSSILKLDGFKTNVSIKTLYTRREYCSLCPNLIDELFKELLKQDKKRYSKLIMELKLAKKE